MADRLNFIAFGDFGFTTPIQAENIRMMHGYRDGTNVDAVFLMGDNFYNYGVRSTADPLWRVFEAAYTPWCPFYAVLGNHDYLGNVDAQLMYNRTTRTHWEMPARYYDRIFCPADNGFRVHVFFLDTFTLCPEQSRACSVPMGMHDFDRRYTRKDTEQYTWLGEGLAQCRCEWKVVVGHYPVFSNGVHGDSPELVRDLLPLLRRHGVDFYLSGHDHDMEFMRKDDINFIVSGTGCSSNPVRKSHESIYCSDTTTWGFHTLQFTRRSCRFGFFTNNGSSMWHSLPNNSRISYSTQPPGR